MQQRGMVLVVTLVLLSLALVIGMAGMKTAWIAERMSGNQRVGISALALAEYGAAEALKRDVPRRISSGQCLEDAGSAPDYSAKAIYRYRACKSSQGGIVNIVVSGDYSGVERHVSFEYILPTGFLGLSPVNLPTPLNRVDAKAYGHVIEEGRTISDIHGGRYPAIAMNDGDRNLTDPLDWERRGYHVVPGIGDISESILTDPEAFHGFIDKVHAVAESRSRVRASHPGTDGPRPVLTYVDGDLDIGQPYSGAGLLVVNGNLEVHDAFEFEGLMIVLGTSFQMRNQLASQIRGAIIVAPSNRQDDGSVSYGIADVILSDGGQVDYIYDAGALESAFSLLAATEAEAAWQNDNHSSRKPGIVRWQESGATAE